MLTTVQSGPELTSFPPNLESFIAATVIAATAAITTVVVIADLGINTEEHPVVPGCDSRAIRIALHIPAKL